ncbi:MAG: hypothetical protein AMXMBFR34_36360 [Myxococcaceae bacterium]
MRMACILVLLAGAAWAQSAAQLNAQGFEAYKEQQYPEALQKFQEAIAHDEKYALAHYNLAATLALMRSRGLTCQFDAYQATILAALERSIALDPRRRKRALEDSDFESIHQTIGWQRVKGLTVEKHARDILIAVHWYGPSPGAYGPLSELRFGKDGAVQGSAVDLSGDEVKRVPMKGRWTMKGRVVTVTYGEGKDAKSIVYRMQDDGRLLQQGGGSELLTDDPDDCSA